MNTVNNWSSSVQLLSHVRHFVTPWMAAHQASLSITDSRTFLKLVSVELVMPSNHLILFCPLLPLSSLFPSISIFSKECVLRIRCPSIESSASASVLPTQYSGLISFRIDWCDLLAVQGTFKSLFHTTVHKHQFFSPQPSLWYSSHICTRLLEKPQF